VTAETLLRLALVPLAVWLASLAARRWGHKVSGYLGGMPLIGGPITLFLALDHGAAFAARSATFTLAAILGQAAHLLAFAWVAQRRRWPTALFAGWSAFAVAAALVVALDPAPLAALGLALAGLLTAQRALPRYRGATSLPAVPLAELRLRLAAAFVLAAVILWSARAFGPVVSGVLLSLPITGSIMPPFTLALYGPDAVARLLRGFIVGLFGFTTFFFVLSTSAVFLGVALSFTLALAAALAVVFLAARILRTAQAS
jgi:hypothetical protein